jgi:hypothetical protein
MANVAQMAVDAFWAQLTRLEALAGRLRADLAADKLELQNAYTAARANPDPEQGAAAMAALNPLIHNNSALRMRFNELNAAFTNAVNGASAVLKRAGLSTPALSTLSGLGQAQLLVPVVAVAALATAFVIYQSVRTATDSQRRATAAMLDILRDPSSSPADKAAAAAALRRAASIPPVNPFDLGALVPIGVIVLAIVVGPQLLRQFGPRRAAA